MIDFEKIREFLIESLRLGDHPREEQDEMLARLQEVVEDQINRSVNDMLEEGDRLKAEGLRRAGDADALHDFLLRKIPNLPIALESIGLQVLRDYGVDLGQ